MDRAITASDANQRFSEMLREVQEGESFIVMARGRPVARVLPVDDAADQARAVVELIGSLAARPRRQVEGWRRDDLYE